MKIKIKPIKSIYLQGSIQNWVFWHRIHHKYYGTEKDPYNHNKGFFYSHVYSNLLSAPSDLDTYIKSIDMRDLEDDKFVWIQHKYIYFSLYIEKDHKMELYIINV